MKGTKKVSKAVAQQCNKYIFLSYTISNHFQNSIDGGRPSESETVRMTLITLKKILTFLSTL